MSTFSHEAALFQLLRRAHVDWNWLISREKYLKIDCSVKMPCCLISELLAHYEDFLKIVSRRRASRFNDKVVQTNPFLICKTNLLRGLKMHFQDLDHSFSLTGPPKPANDIYLLATNIFKVRF